MKCISRLAALPLLVQMKELLAQRAAHDKIRDLGGEKDATMNKVQAKQANVRSITEPIKQVESRVAQNKAPSTMKRPEPEKMDPLPPAKRSKAATAANFLSIGAVRAKEKRSARNLARVGVDRSKKNNKTSHTGSGVPLAQVVRLKYVKGFTQAVRTPCRLEDLA